MTVGCSQLHTGVDARRILVGRQLIVRRWVANVGAKLGFARKGLSLPESVSSPKAGGPSDLVASLLNETLSKGIQHNLGRIVQTQFLHEVGSMGLDS